MAVMKNSALNSFYMNAHRTSIGKEIIRIVTFSSVVSIRSMSIWYFSKNLRLNKNLALVDNCLTLELKIY